jgi:hypothetical protein
MNTRNASVVLVAAVSAMLAGNNVANAGLELVIKNTDAVPGISGAAWNTSTPFQTPSIDTNGDVGFRGTMLVGTGGVLSTDNSTMYHGAPGGLSLFARTGNQAPGLPAGVLSTGFQTQNVSMSPNGTVWYGGATSAPSGYVATGAPGSLTKVARNGDVLPGSALAISGSPSSSTGYSSVNNAGHTIIACSFTGGASLGVWVGNGANLNMAYQTGVTYSSLPNATVKSPAGYSINGTGALLSDIVLNNNAGAGVDDNNNQVLAIMPFGGTNFNVIAREFDVAPGTGGANYQRAFLQPPPLSFEGAAFTFGNGNFNNGGNGIYSAGLEGTGVVTANNAAIFSHDGTTSQLFRRKGDAVSSIAGATYTFDTSAAFQARLNNNDTVAWWSRLTQGGDVTSANDTVLSRTSLGSASDTLIAREGSASVVPGALWGTNFSDIMQNNADQIVFTSILLDDPNDPNNNVTAANDQGIFAWDPNMGMAMIAREGDSLASIGINMTVTSINLFNAANADGGANALSDNGWLTFRVSGTALAGFTDTSAIVRTQVPEPTSAIALFVAGGLMALRRRRSN